MTFIVRPLQESDFENGYFETISNLKESPRLANASELVARMRAQGSELFVAATDGHVIGAATVLIEQKLLAGGALCGHVEDVATRKGYERQGVGRAVVTAAVAHAKARGCYKIVLDCSDENVQFYEKLGFKRRANEMIIKFE